MSTQHKSIAAPEAHTSHSPSVHESSERRQISKSCVYQNNLMWQVGLLELSNAMDWPANVFNAVPIPVYAAVLMGIGGSIAILWSVFPIWDMRKSLANISLLREERRYLKQWQQEMEKEDVDTRILVQAWLDVNFRELGWECIDRVLMDICAGISGVLVGTGCLMAIRGDIDNVFLASNLLSGYVGNSFLAPFALLNFFWAVFMWHRAGGERRVLSVGKAQIDAELQTKMRHHSRKHKLYAVVNGLTAIVGTVGSITSATLWYGYVVIAPAVVTSILSNLFWRYKMGYDRKLITQRRDLRFNIIGKLHCVQTALTAVESGTVDQLPCFVEGEPEEAVYQFLSTLGLEDELHHRLDIEQRTTTSSTLKDRNAGVLSRLAGATMIEESRGALRDQERFLIELFGRYLKRMELHVREDEKNVLPDD